MRAGRVISRIHSGGSKEKKEHEFDVQLKNGHVISAVPQGCLIAADAKPLLEIMATAANYKIVENRKKSGRNDDLQVHFGQGKIHRRSLMIASSVVPSGRGGGGAAGGGDLLSAISDDDGGASAAPPQLDAAAISAAREPSNSLSLMRKVCVFACVVCARAPLSQCDVPR